MSNSNAHILCLITHLQQKLDDLEEKSAFMASDFEAKLQSQTLLAGVTQKRVSFANDKSFESATSPQSLLYAASTVGADQDQSEAKERIKAKFRQRRSQSRGDQGAEQSKSSGSAGKQKLSGQAHQRLKFYERSLQAVQPNNI